MKVDREERPDVDRVYMTFVQATTGSGGWPMSVWLTPDLKPFFGGTYYPPDNRYGRPGFGSLLQQIALAWATDRAKIVASGDNVLERLRSATETPSGGSVPDEAEVRSRLFLHLRRSFDTKFGGFGNAPKFPRPVTLNFLMREAAWSANDEALEMALATLREMAKGGMHDHLGGGFHRYSVDARWFVPHFEKMLYDQAQLAIAYLEAFQITQEENFRTVARGILDYVLRDMRHSGGGFFSAEDADSAVDETNPREKREGAFYVWDFREIEDLLGKEADEFTRAYGVLPDGNVFEDPHGEFPGKNILALAEPVTGFARERQILLEARSKRPRPHLDDKILTGWNGLMISAFAKGAQVLNDSRYRDAALAAAAFVEQNLTTADGGLLRRWREGEGAVAGFLDDYAFFAQASIDLYETTFDQHWIDLARKLTDRMVEQFEDQAAGGFFSTCEGDSDLVMRLKEDYDGAEPSGNSIAILNLLRLEQITRQEGDHAGRALAAFHRTLTEQPTTAPQMVIALAASERKAQQIVIAGENEGAAGLLQVAHRAFAPFRVILRSPASGEFPMVSGQTTAYVCEDFTCQAPVTDPAKLAELLT